MSKKPNKTKQNKRAYSRPAIEKQLTVTSEAAINAAETYMKNTMSAIYALDVILYYIADPATTEAANQKVAEMLEEKIARFNKDISKYQNTVEELDLAEAKYTEEHSETYLIYSPLCGQYIQLIKKFDNLTGLIDQLWLNNEMPSKKRNSEVWKLKNHLLNVSRQLINASRTAMKLAKSQGQSENVESSIATLGVDDETLKDVTNDKKAVQVVADDAIESEDASEDIAVNA
ncbi:hypothetical protein [Vibrio coralliilyticus]|uniref:DUF1845 domain-containing protein n=1 Tax=Vibrio coralliilyticus TaxID=190893 RepID=A0AAP6ZSU9_9VIBR|nr:hypothetical protein [Vibrio coralliilyticus]NOI31846.1 hypothetical protein [Vibrio coralliilyticus]NOJ25290.1 hypothetical protein [Vibrio coralliilyticus]